MARKASALPTGLSLWPLHIHPSSESIILGCGGDALLPLLIGSVWETGPQTEKISIGM